MTKGPWILVCLISVLLLTDCYHKPAKAQYQIVIPHECIQSDVVCTQTPGKKKMNCNFKKFEKCEHVKVGE